MHTCTWKKIKLANSSCPTHIPKKMASLKCALDGSQCIQRGTRPEEVHIRCNPLPGRPDGPEAKIQPVPGRPGKPEPPSSLDGNLGLAPGQPPGRPGPKLGCKEACRNMSDTLYVAPSCTCTWKKIQLANKSRNTCTAQDFFNFPLLSVAAAGRPPLAISGWHGRWRQTSA